MSRGTCPVASPGAWATQQRQESRPSGCPSPALARTQGREGQSQAGWSCSHPGNANSATYQKAHARGWPRVCARYLRSKEPAWA